MWPFLGAIFALLGTAGGIVGVATAGDADRLLREGARVTAQTVEVDLSREWSKGGPYIAIEQVRATIPGYDQPVSLEWTGSGRANELDPDTTTLGWQAARRDTGYAAPLDVLVETQADGSVLAMAVEDVQRGRNEAGFWWATLVVSLLAVAGGTTYAVLRAKPQRR